MIPIEWLEYATCFDLGTCPVHRRHIEIEARDQIDGSRLWVFKMERTKGWVLGKDGEWYWEPLPSYRTDEFIALTRFNSPQEALDCYKQFGMIAKPKYLKDILNPQ